MPRVHQGWGNSGKNRGTMVVEYDTHHPPAPWASSWLHSGDKNSLPYRNNLLQGISNINFIFMGETKIRQLMVFFLCSRWSCACRPPPTGRLCARPVGGGPMRRLLYYRPAAGILAGRQGHSIFLSEISIVRYHYKMYTRAFSCKDTFSFSLRSLSLYLHHL